MVRAHSQAKQLATGRGSLSLISVLGQKTCTDVTHKFGGADKVPIVSSMLNSVKLSHMEWSSKMKKYEADISKYKAVIEA